MRALRYGRLSCVLMAGALLALVALPGAPLAADDGDLMREAEALGDHLGRLILEGDIDALLAHYTDDAISLPNFAPRMEGKDEIRSHFDQMEAAGVEIHSFESSPTEVWAAGDQVIEIGTFQAKVSMPGMEEPIEDEGKYMTVYVRDDDGELKIKAETWNTDLDPMQVMMGEHQNHGEMHEHGEHHEHGEMHEHGEDHEHHEGHEHHEMHEKEMEKEEGAGSEGGGSSR